LISAQFCAVGDQNLARPEINMKKFALAVSILAVSAVGATAADMAPRYTKAPVMAAPASDWSGFYVGAGVGGKWMDSDWNTTTAFFPTGAVIPFTTDPHARFSGSAVRFSAYAGYNWQLSPVWVAGIEGDVGYADNHRTEASRIPGLGLLNAGSFTQVKGTWDASIRGRAGYLITPSLLAYGTAGVSFQHVQAVATCPADTFVCNPAVGTQSFSNSSDRVGWTVGGGLEGKISQNWLARAEYRYSDFGAFSFNAIPFTISTFGANARLSTTTQIVTVGLAYKFGGPIVAKY
jgi:outer membrane immunogenic protein